MNDHIWLQMQINGYTSSNLTLTSCLQVNTALRLVEKVLRLSVA